MPVRTHQIPTHLDQEDTLLWNFSSRQILVLGVGIAFAFLTANNLAVLGPIVSTLILVALIGLTFALALVQVKKRPLDQWAVVWLVYYLQPRYYVWRPLRLEALPED